MNQYLHPSKNLKYFGTAAILILLAALVIGCAPAAPEAGEGATLAIEHFSVIEGTTWSGAHDRAGKRIAEKSDNVDYVFREEVGPDLSVPYAEELIADGANIVIGNAEFMGMPLIDIADQQQIVIRQATEQLGREPQQPVQTFLVM